MWIVYSAIREFTHLRQYLNIPIGNNFSSNSHRDMGENMQKHQDRGIKSFSSPKLNIDACKKNSRKK